MSCSPSSESFLKYGTAQQIENIRNGRRIFEPQALAHRFSDIVKESQKALSQDE